MSEAAPNERDRLRIALVAYRGNPRCGGQGVYCRQLSRHLVELGHEVTVFSGPPYPVLAERVELVRVPSLDLYREQDPFRLPRRREIESLADLYEIAIMRCGGFPEPRTFGLRLEHALAARGEAFDLIHDNQGLSHGIRRLNRSGWPLVASIHHPISIDRSLDLAHASGSLRKMSIRRWYGFGRMQRRTARALDRIITVSSSSRADIVRDYGIDEGKIAVVPVGVDTEVYRPHPEVARVPGRIMTTASADVPLKGLIFLLEALAKIRTERPEAHLVVVGSLRRHSPVAQALDRLGLRDAVRFVAGESDEAIARRYGEACCAVVPSLYEGFSLPAIEAMACGVPLVATTGGALPEVVGIDQVTALLVAPGDASALAQAIGRLLGEERLRARLGEAGLRRVVEQFSWRACAEGTVEQYRAVLAGSPRC